MPDVMVVTMALSRIPKTAEMVVAKFAHERVGSLNEPPSLKVNFANLVDHMACDGFLASVSKTLRPLNPNETALIETAALDCDYHGKGD